MAARSDIDDAIRLRLACALQTTLDVESLTGILDRHLHEVVPHTGLRFVHEGADIDIATRSCRGHSHELALNLDGEPLGRLHVHTREPLSCAQAQAVDELLDLALHALRNALMYRAALNASVRDPLTGVNNRSSFREVLDREVDLAHRHGAPLSLIMIDVDRFKAINDQYGHATGDVALKSIAHCMLGCIRESDILFRYGGEEFCIALANTNLAGARKLAERVRRALEILVVRASGRRLHVTASLGVATLGAGDDAANLVENADESLYRAKALGRNRIATQEDRDALAE